MEKISFLTHFPSNKQQIVAQDLENKCPCFFLLLEEYANHYTIEVVYAPSCYSISEKLKAKVNLNRSPRSGRSFMFSQNFPTP